MSAEEIIANLIQDLRDELEAVTGRFVPTYEVIGALHIAAGGWDRIDFIALCCDTAHVRLKALEGEEKEEPGELF